MYNYTDYVNGRKGSITHLSETDTPSGPGDLGEPSLRSKSILLTEVLEGSIETDLGGGDGT